MVGCVYTNVFLKEVGSLTAVSLRLFVSLRPRRGEKLRVATPEQAGPPARQVARPRGQVPAGPRPPAVPARPSRRGAHVRRGRGRGLLRGRVRLQAQAVPRLRHLGKLQVSPRGKGRTRTFFVLASTFACARAPCFVNCCSFLRSLQQLSPPQAQVPGPCPVRFCGRAQAEEVKVPRAAQVPGGQKVARGAEDAAAGRSARSRAPAEEAAEGPVPRSVKTTRLAASFPLQ